MAKGDGCTRYREEKEIVRVFDCQFDPGFARRSRGWPARLGVRGRIKTEGEGGQGIGQDSGLFTRLALKCVCRVS